MIPQESFIRKKRSWLFAALAVTGMFLFTAAKKAPEAEIVITSPEESGFKTIVFDLGDVLFETSKSTQKSLFIPVILKNPTLLYKLLSLDAKKEFFNILETIPAESKDPIYNKGQRLPLILADWMSGLKTPQDIKFLADKAIESSNFSIAEKNLFYGVSDLMFNPEKLANSQSIVMPMAQLLKKLKLAGYQICVLSNWDEYSFTEVCKKYPKLFDLCDHILISGKEKLSKPDPEFFNKLLNNLKLNPTECIFIDDEPYNIKAAQKLGLKSIEHKSRLETSKELIKCGVINLKVQVQE